MYPVSLIYGNCANQGYMVLALALACCNIEADQGGPQYTRARVSWEGGSHAVLFMVPLGPPGVRPTAQALRLSFEYYTIYIHVHVHIQSVQTCMSGVYLEGGGGAFVPP